MLLRVAALTLLAACHGAGDEAVTYQRDVRPIVESRCMDCHAPGGVAPLDMTFDASWTDGRPPWAEAAAAAVADGSMPPWQAASDCHPIADVRDVTDDERALFAAWASGGFEAGAAADFQPPAPIEHPMDARGATFGEPDFVLGGEAPYTPNTDKPDDYRCIVTDLDPLEDLWIRGAEIELDKSEIVHHLIAYVFSPNQAAGVDAQDAADPGPGYTCWGNPPADPLMTWAPGQRAEFLPEGMGRYIERGSRVVLQVHYNTLGRSEIPADATKLRLWMTPGNAVPENLLTSIAFPDMNLYIPAGDPKVVERSELSVSDYFGPLPIQLPVLGVMAHMHQLGSAISLDVKQGRQAKACVLDIPEWDFAWQQTYYFPEDDPLMVDGDTTFHMACTYDNSAANQQVVNGEQLEPRDVTWGDSTLDEMCLTYLMTSIPTALFQ